MLKLQHWKYDIEKLMINRLRDYCERRGFEVCSRMGDRMGVRPSVVRLYFIYTSFIGLGSPLIIYLILAFWIKLKDYIAPSRDSILDL